MDEGQADASKKLFFIILAGKTNDAHHDFVKKLEAVGHTEASSPEGCDYVVCFCPVASRVGTDVSEALDKIPAEKPSILVVMHHTFNPDLVVAESRRLVTSPDILLTVDCLFYEGQFLKCTRNDAAWDEVKKFLGISDSQERSFISFFNWSSWNSSAELVEKANEEHPVCVKKPKVDDESDDSFDKDYVNIDQSDIKDVSEAQNKMTVLGRKFFVILAGKTNGAHHDFVKKLKAVGHTEASSPEGCDYVVCFCPVASRIGTDVSEALNKIPADKPSILVVMHHTFNPDLVVAESRKLVTSPDVLLTVDCLFHEGQFLKCKRNDAAWDEVKKKLGLSDIQVSKMSSIKMSSQNTFSVLQMNGNGEKKAHRDFVEKLKKIGLTEVSCYEESYHLVIFCYVTSEDDIHAVNSIAAQKPTILVVMHNTSKPHHVVAESRRLVTNPNFKLTVDCLYNEDHFLQCKHNDAAWDEVKKYLRVSDSQGSKITDTLKFWFCRTPAPNRVHIQTIASKSHADQAPVQAPPLEPAPDQAAVQAPPLEPAPDQAAVQDPAPVGSLI